jgi:hypothetical protein
MIMVMGTEGFSNAGNNNCDTERERKRKRAREERERALRRREFRKCWSSGGGAWRRRKDGRTDGRDGKKYSIFSKLVHFLKFSLVSFSSIAKPKST